MIRVAIVDDEAHCITALKWLLERLPAKTVVVAEFTDPLKARTYIAEADFDLLFLDVHMPGLTGFELLKDVVNPRFEIVFTTAYDKYAVAAFKLNALDYLLKPIEKEDLEQTLAKFIKKQEAGGLSQKIQDLLEQVSLQAGQRIRLRLPTASGFELVDPMDIVRLEASGNYSHIVFSNRSGLYTKSLGALEGLLPASDFFRTHHSHIVNLSLVQSYHKGKGGELLMANGDTVPVARNRKDALMDIL